MVIKRVTFSHFEILKHSLPFYPFLFSNRSNNKRQTQAERALRTSRRGSLPFKKIFQQSGEGSGGEIRETKEDVRV